MLQRLNGEKHRNVNAQCEWSSPRKEARNAERLTYSVSAGSTSMEAAASACVTLELRLSVPCEKEPEEESCRRKCAPMPAASASGLEAEGANGSLSSDEISSSSARVISCDETASKSTTRVRSVLASSAAYASEELNTRSEDSVATQGSGSWRANCRRLPTSPENLTKNNAFIEYEYNTYYKIKWLGKYDDENSNLF